MSSSSSGNGGAAAASAPSVSATPKKEGQGKMQQLLSLARERLREQQVELAARDRTIKDLEDQLAAKEKKEPSDEKPKAAWCQVCESSLGIDGSGRWVLFEFFSDDDDDDGDATSPSWVRFADVASLEDFVRRDPGTEPLEVPEPSMTQFEAKRLRESCEAAVARANDDFRKFRVQTEIERKRREANDREAAARRELLGEADDENQRQKKTQDLPADLLTEDAFARLQDEITSLRAENDLLKKNNFYNSRRAAAATEQPPRSPTQQTVDDDDNDDEGDEKLLFESSSSRTSRPRARKTHHHHNFDENEENDDDPAAASVVTSRRGALLFDLSSPEDLTPRPGDDVATAAAKWKERYEKVQKEREKLASQVRSLTDAGASSSEYAGLSRDYDALQKEYKSYRANALKAMRLQEQELKAAKARALDEKKALDKLGNRSKTKIKDAPGAGGGAPDNDRAKIHYLKNLMTKYLATTEAKAKEHMERAILMVLGFTDEEKNNINANTSTIASTLTVGLFG